jgi:acyl dehydratase
MPINPAAVGATSDPIERSWNSKDCLLYAVGVGAGVPDPFAELPFTTENSSGIDQQCLPTYAVIVGGGAMGAMANIGEFNPAMLVHAEQGFTLHKPLPTQGKVKVSGKITGVYDKGSGALVALESNAVDASTGEPMFDTMFSAFIRGEGGFGGDRGPSGRPEPPDRDADDVVSYTTKPEQALIYRLSGDRNPLHSDPEFAKLGGFDRPILHGLCTYGFTGRALLHTLCESDPTRFTSMHGRFTKPVFPGETLTVSIWADGGDAVFRTTTDDGSAVLDGKCTFTS